MKYIYLTTLAACLSMFLTCTDNVTGNNNKDDINTVPAMLYNLDGSPAVHAKVRFFPVNYNPRSSNLSKKMAIVDSATTDSTGNYSVKLDPGKYNVLATGKSGVVYQSAITVSKDSTINPPVDTLKSPGGLSGRVKLQPGDDARTVFILFMGTNIWVTPDDSMGNFTALNMAQGTYKVRILTTLDQYVPKDTTLSITSGVIDTLQNNITLKYTGIPKPAGVIVSYDTLRQTVILEWSGVDTSIITGYNVYRAIKGQNLSLLTQTPLADTVTTFHDSTVSVGKTYQYEVVSYRSGQESQKAINPSDTMKALPSSLATTTFTCNLNEAIYDTAGIGDTIKICLTYSNPTRKVVKVFWYLDSLNSTAVRQKKDSSLTGKDTLSYSWKITGIKKIFVKAIDEAGTVWTDTYGISIIQDAPDITFISDDTTVNYGGAVRCSFYVKQKFGSMDVAIDTSNSGKFKNLGGFGLSGSKVYTFSTGNACTWDSVKVRVTDNRGNTVTKGFDVNIRLNSPTIKKINPDTTIGIGDSVTFNVSAVDSSGGITQIAWDFDGNGKYDWTSPTLQASGYRYQTTGLYKAVLRLTNECQKQTYDTVSMAVVQDVPIIRFLSDDTIVDHGGSVRCSVFVQQQFGTMTIEIDTSNNGSYKALGNLGLSGSKKYLFSTGNACTWDSVKVRVTDNGMNVVTKGFRVRIRPRPLSITSIDSTVNTITIHYSKTKETDFSSYLIYRNTTSTVDTNSELWATITDNGITSYTLPAPSYALAPRYYRIYQRDNEGLWCVGSNVVYGNIVKSPPDKPVVIFPENNGDSIWPNDVLRWSCTPLTLNGLKISCKVFVNYNNTGYSQLATEPMDTSVRLTGCDTVQYLKFKITAFDSLGDSSSSSEKTAYIRHTVTDIDGNVYQTVTIGTQLWVVENLRTTKYNDGTAIPHVTDRAQWSSLSTPGYCWYDNSTVTTEHEKWGALYNWHAVNTGKLAPAGWHVPTDADWITIENYLIVDSFNNKNRTGFSVLPGYRDINGNFIQRGFEGYWWCVKEDGAPRTYIRYHNCLDADLSGPYGGGLSVRLLRD